MDWQPIETAPRDGTYLLGYDGEPIVIIAYESGWEYGDNFIAGNVNEKPRPTHWIPLPAPPL